MAKGKDELAKTKELVLKFNTGKLTDVKDQRDLKNILDSLKERKPEAFKKGQFAKEFTKAFKELEKIKFEEIGEQIGKGMSKGIQKVSPQQKLAEKPSPQQKEAEELSPQQKLAVTPSPQQPPSTWLKKLEEYEERIRTGTKDFTKEEEEKYDRYKKMREDQERLQEEYKEEHTKWGKAKKYGGKVKDFGLKIKNLSIPGLGNVGQQVLSPFEAAMWSGIFGFSLFLLFFFSTRFFIPMVEGYTATPIMPQSFSLYIEPFLVSSWYYLPIMVLLATFPLALVGGITKVNLKGPSKACLTIAAIEGSILLLNNYGLPWTAAMFPEQAAFFKCMVKYNGNMQICALNQTQQVYVEKTGSYEVLALDLGVVTPSRTMPPINPNPSSNFLPYYFIFTLKNKNQVGSPYNISVNTEDRDNNSFLDGIMATATDSNPEDETDGYYEADDYPYYPKYSISPGGYVVAQAMFDDEDGEGLPACWEKEPYTYFHINITTDQNAGGSAKIGVISSDEGIDNQNFMYFFDPDVKTQPGPVDLYVYTIPFVLPTTRVLPATDGDPFLTFIPIENKGNGIIDRIDIEFIYDSGILDIPSDSYLQYCAGTVCNATIHLTGCSGGRCTFYSEGEIEAGETYTILFNDGRLTSLDMVGKYTGLISAVATYRYKQQFDEQIACIQGQSPAEAISAVCNDNCISQGYSSGLCCCLGGAPLQECPEDPDPSYWFDGVGESVGCPSDPVCDYGIILGTEARKCMCWS